MSMGWVIIGILAYLGLAVMLGRFIGGRGLRRIRREILEEALPFAAPGEREANPAAALGRREWTEVTNLTALSAWSPPAPSAPRAAPSTEAVSDREAAPHRGAPTP